MRQTGEILRSAARGQSEAYDRANKGFSYYTPYKATLKLNQRYLDRQTMGNVEQIQTHQPLRETQKWSGKCPSGDPD